MDKETTLKEWLGDSQLGTDIINKKYLQENETFMEWAERVSGGNQEVKRLFIEQKFIPAGRILSNRGLNNKGIKSTLSNCYVLTVDDSIESIYQCCSNMARTYSYGGGVGIDISKLRPSGAIVHNSARSTTGAVSFMKTFDVVTGTIGQNGRRGALMISISVNHPDVLEFVDIKANTDQITNANISVRVNDKFMKAVENDTDYLLHWPCEMDISDKEIDAVEDYNQLTCVETISGPVYLKKIKARDLFMKLAKNNWDYGEPGILYWDRIKNWHMMSANSEFEYAGVNPCLTGDSLVQTVEGEIPIKDLVGTTPFVYCMDENGQLTIRKAIKVWKTRENANLVEVITGKGRLICTPDHRIYTTNRGWVEAINLQPKDKIKGLNRQTTGHKYCSVGLSGTQYEKEHRFITRHFYDIEGMDVHHINDDGFDNRLSNLEVITHEEHSRLSNTGRIIEVNRDLETGRYLEKDEHTPRECRNLGKQVGTNWYVCEVRELDYTEDVYDMTVEDTHNFIANGFVVHNCAEEPLPNGGACLLGAMNLYKYVNDNGEFMFDEFKKDVKIATVGLNQIQVEGTELHPLEVQRENAKKYRQIGLGIFDLGGALIKMGVTYGTPESRKIAYNITHEMLISAFEQSCDLNTAGVEYPGLFNSDFYKKQIEPYIGKQYKGRYPLNSQLLTIAPTGTTSTMVNATAGGGEPMFAKLYTRSTKSIGEVDYVVYPQAVLDYLGKDFDKNNLNVDYINENMNKLPDYFVSADIIEPKDRILMQAALQENIDASISSTINLPEKATVQDVYDIYLQAWSNGLKGVTVFREGCKRAAILNRTTEKKESEVIFNTVNAPKRPKVLDGDYYQVKVQGKTFIIIVGLMDGKPYEMFVLPCDECQKVKNHRGKITRVKKRVYKFESEIMEIPNIAIEVDNDYDINGEIEKISSIVNEGHKLSKGDVEIIRDSVYNIKEYSEKREYRNVSIHVSGNLRTGMRLEDIIKLEDKCNDSIVSFNKAVARVLSKYMPNEEETGDTCPECGAALVREEGCIHCPKCGWSRCS